MLCPPPPQSSPIKGEDNICNFTFFQDDTLSRRITMMLPPKDPFNVIIGGVGGQGNVLASQILGEMLVFQVIRSLPISS